MGKQLSKNTGSSLKLQSTRRWIKRFSDLLPLSTLLLISSIFFFPKLGLTPLKSWDEAWYAEISRNILKTGNWFLLKWNGLPYFDHPPFGFWLMALSFRFFRVSEFAARLPSAITGIFSVLLIYSIAKELFNEFVGLNAGLILTTMPWFWLRSREGNLDIILTFLMLLSLWLGLKLQKNEKLLPFLAITFGFTLLTKSVIGLGLLPTILYIVLTSKSKFTKACLLFTASGLLLTLLPWYLTNYQVYGPQFIDRNIFVTGLKIAGYGAIFSQVGKTTLNLNNSFQQIHNGILLWYKPFLISLLGLIFLKKKSFQILFLWLGVYLLLFSTSSKVELWHFIILYPAISLLISAFMQTFLKTIFDFGNKFLKLKYFTNQSVLLVSFVITFIFITWNGNRIVKGLYKDIVKNQPTNDEVVLATMAGKYQEVTYIDDDYWPTAVFYAKKNIIHIVHANQYS